MNGSGTNIRTAYSMFASCSLSATNSKFSGFMVHGNESACPGLASSALCQKICGSGVGSGIGANAVVAEVEWVRWQNPPRYLGGYYFSNRPAAPEPADASPPLRVNARRSAIKSTADLPAAWANPDPGPP